MLFDEYQALKEDHDSLLLHLTKKDEIIQGLLGFRHKLEAEVYQLQNVEKTIVVELLGSPTDIDCSPSICKKVDVSISSYVLLSTYDVVSPNFEKHITSTGSQLLRKMGYTRGRLRKNGHGIVVPIAPKMYISREGLGYDVLVSSLSSSGLAKSRKVVFVGGGVQTKLLEEQTTTKCVEHIHIVAMLELETSIVDGIFDNVEGFTHVTTLCLDPTSSILLEQKYDPYHHPHKNQRTFLGSQILGKWKLCFQIFARRHERLNHGLVLIIRVDYGWRDEWY